MRVYARKKKKRPEIRRVARNTFDELIDAGAMFIYNNLRLFVVFAQILLFIVLILLAPYVDGLFLILIYVVSLIIVEYLFRFNQNIKNETDTGIPVPPQRLTKVDDRGYIEITEEEESIQYLCELENYLESKGYLKDNDSTV